MRGGRGDRYGVSRSFRTRAASCHALSPALPARALPPGAGCRPARRGVGRVYAGRYHRSIVRRDGGTRRSRPSRAGGGSRSRRFYLAIPYRLTAKYNSRDFRIVHRTDRIGLLTDSTRMSAVPGMRIYTHTAAGACRRLGLLQGWFATALDLVRVRYTNLGLRAWELPPQSGVWDVGLPQWESPSADGGTRRFRRRYCVAFTDHRSTASIGPPHEMISNPVCTLCAIGRVAGMPAGQRVPCARRTTLACESLVALHALGDLPQNLGATRQGEVHTPELQPR